MISIKFLYDEKGKELLFSTLSKQGWKITIDKSIEYYENMYMLGVVALFFVNSNPWSYLGAVVAIFVLYFLEILIDNSSARVKSGLMIKQAWWVTFIAAGLNLLILMLIK